MITKFLTGIITFLFLLVFSTSFAQVATINLSITNYPDSIVTYTPPINGMAFWLDKKEIKISPDGKCELKIPLKHSGLLFIAMRNNESVPFRLFIQPGGKYALSINAKQRELFVFKGKNNEGNRLLNTMQLPHYWKASEIFRKDSTLITAADIEHRMDSLITAGSIPYKKLWIQKKIDKAFYQFANINVRYYYALVFAHVLRNHFYMTATRDHAPALEHMPAGFAKLWEKILREYPADNPAALQFMYLQDYAITNYLDWYKQSSIPGGAADDDFKFERSLNEDERLVRTFAAIKKSFKGQFLETLLAQKIAYEAIQSHFQKALITEFEAFQEMYPRSLFLPGLQKIIDPIIVYHTKAAADFDKQEKIIEGYDRIDSLSQLLNLFRGRPVFIDVWATWCGPCKEEFKYKDGLVKFLKQQQIELLYLSIDDQRFDAKWKNMIKYYDLEGYHARTNQDFQNNMIAIFDQNGSITIPWYIIVDKNGKIVKKKAKRPSDHDALYAEIREALQN